MSEGSKPVPKSKKSAGKAFVFGKSVSVTDREVASAIGTPSEPRKGKPLAISRTADSDDEDATIVKNRSSKSDKERTQRTVFVGNLPAKVAKKKITQLFKQFGEIESIRFRSIGLASLAIDESKAKAGISRAQSVKTRAKHENDATSINAYIVFKDLASAKNSVAANNTDIGHGKKIRVDLAANSKKHDHQRSIFVGNLDWEVTDEELRTFFADCGDIERVRIIRDPLTSAGKGFGYVTFADRSSVGTALQMKDMQLRNRPVRVSKSTANPTDSKGNLTGGKRGIPETKKSAPTKLVSKKGKVIAPLDADGASDSKSAKKNSSKRDADGKKRRWKKEGKTHSDNTNKKDVKLDDTHKKSFNESSFEWQGLTAKPGVIPLSNSGKASQIINKPGSKKRKRQEKEANQKRKQLKKDKKAALKKQASA